MTTRVREHEPAEILDQLTAYARAPEGVLRRLARYAEEAQPPLPPLPAPPEAPATATVVDTTVVRGELLAALRAPDDDLIPHPRSRRGFLGLRRRARSGSRRRAR